MTVKKLRYLCGLMVLVLTLMAGGLAARAVQLVQKEGDAGGITMPSDLYLNSGDPSSYPEPATPVQPEPVEAEQAAPVEPDQAQASSFESASVSQVRFSEPRGMYVEWSKWREGVFDSDMLETPARTNLRQGKTHFLKLTHIPGHEGLVLLPTVEIAPADSNTNSYLALNAIPIEFTPRDVAHVLAGHALCKAIYLLDDEKRRTPQSLASHEFDAGDPVAEADRQGSILAVIRLTNSGTRAPKAGDELPGGPGEDQLAQLAPPVKGAANPPAKGADPAKTKGPATPPPAEAPKEETPPAKSSSDPEAIRILDQAAKNLASIDWVKAGIRQRVELFGKRLDGTGTYLKGPNWKMKLELKIALDDRRPPSSMQQVCDGRWLYDHREILGNRVLTKVDVTAVRDALERGPARPGQLPTQTVLGLGGLEQLLRGLRSQFDFTMAGNMKVGERSFIALRGRWQRDVLARMLPDQKKDILEGKPVNLKKLPEYVPDEVLLLLDPKTLFIHRVEYRRTDAPADDDKSGDKGESKGKSSKLSGKSLIIMELYDVHLNEPVDDLNFLYKSDLPAVDQTEGYLRMLKGEPEPKSDKAD